ncbi:uncharacterized protein TNCV_2035002 [Trichonephila clavipes]|nr:uncharacterized protein TNCV_2035002 [Trichonephila clavipes]
MDVYGYGDDLNNPWTLYVNRGLLKLVEALECYEACAVGVIWCLFCKPAVIINQFNRKLSDLNVPKESIAFSSLEEKHFRHFERKTFETVLISYLVLHEHLTNYPPKDGYQSVLLDAMTLEFQNLFYTYLQQKKFINDLKLEIGNKPTSLKPQETLTLALDTDGTPLAQFPSSVLNLQTELKEKIGKQLYLKSLKKWSVLQCGHCICPICIHKLGESATTLCPVCRQNASFTDALYVDLNTKGRLCGYGSLVLKVINSWLVGHEFELSAAEDPPYALQGKLEMSEWDIINFTTCLAKKKLLIDENILNLG